MTLTVMTNPGIMRYSSSEQIFLDHAVNTVGSKQNINLDLLARLMCKLRIIVTKKVVSPDRSVSRGLSKSIFWIDNIVNHEGMLYDSQRMNSAITHICQERKGNMVQDSINIKNSTLDDLEQISCNNCMYTSLYALGDSKKIVEIHDAVKIYTKKNSYGKSWHYLGHCHNPTQPNIN